MEKQLTLLTLSLLAGLQLTACSGQKDSSDVWYDNHVNIIANDSNDPSARKTLALKDFTGIDCAGVTDVHFTQHHDYKVQVDDPDNILKKVYVKDGRLIIETKSRVSGDVRRPQVYLWAPTLKRLSISGVSSFQTKELSADDFRLDLTGVSTVNLGTLHCRTYHSEGSGVSKVNGTIEGQRATIDCSGVSHDKLIIVTDDLDIDSSGQPDLDIIYKGKTVNIDNSGASTITINVDCERLKARNSGVSKLTISGTADDTDIKSDGVSKVDVTQLNNL